MNDKRRNDSGEPDRVRRSQRVSSLYGRDIEDNIDLVRVISDLWARKWMILVLTTVFAIAGIAYASLATPIYRAEVVLASAQEERNSGLSANLGGLASLAGINLGTQGNRMKALATLRSRAFVESFIVDNQLLPVLFASQWNAAKKEWKSDDPEMHPDIRDGVRFFTNSVRSVSENPESGLITLSIEWTDPDVAASWVQQLVQRINEQLRTRDMDDAKGRLQYLERQLQDASLVELRQAISRLIEGQLQTIMLALAKDEYSFNVIDPPRVPDRPIRPRKILIVVLMTFCGGLFGVFCAIVMNAVRHRRQPMSN